MDVAITHLKTVIQSYYPITEQAWQALLPAFEKRVVGKGECLYELGTVPNSFAFIHSGLMRLYVIDDEGNEFNKNFFCEGRFPGSMSSLLKQQPSNLAVDALEDSEIVTINFAKFRSALFEYSCLMKFHINYLEDHWLLEKEPKEIGYLQYEAKHRYLNFKQKYADLLSRIPQFHIASYLGITPTQLSRIKKDLK